MPSARWSYNLGVFQIQTAFEAATNGQNTTTFQWGGFCQAPTCYEQAPLWFEEYQQRWRSNKICRRIDEAMENVLLLASLKMYTLKHFVIHLIYIRWYLWMKYKEISNNLVVTCIFKLIKTHLMHNLIYWINGKHSNYMKFELGY